MRNQNTSGLVRWYLKRKTALFSVLDTLFWALTSVLPKKKWILMESKPDYSDNTGELFRHMISKGVNRKYRIVWLVDEYENRPQSMPEHVEVYPIHPKTLRQKIRLRYMLCAATCIICSHRFVFPYRKRKGQVFLYLDHGSPLKDCKNIYRDSFTKDTYYIAQSEFFFNAIVEQYNIPREHILPLGLPRNDQLFKTYTSLASVIEGISGYEKRVIWAPTFRYHVSKERIDCHSNMPLGIPVFYTEEDLIRFNAYLQEKNVLLILKPHPAQNIDLIVNLHCSNIRILYSDELAGAGIQTNELLAQTDALITDYSSVYYDYLLLNRPTAITLDDYEQYKEEMGFVFDEPLDVLKGKYIYDMSDIYDFVDGLLAGRDDEKEDRNKILAQIDANRDGLSSQRVLDFLAKKGIK